MSVKLEDRPKAQVKEEVIDILVHNYSHGIIADEAFERRLDAVIAATTNTQMMAEVEDLEATPDETIKQHREKQFNVNYADQPVDDEDWIVNIMGGSDRSGHWSVPKKLNIISIMGGSIIDFTDAHFGTTVQHLHLIKKDL